MTSIDWVRVRPLLARLLELPEGEHKAFLEDACEGDDGLLQTVRRLHDEEMREDRFLRNPFQDGALGVRPLGPGDSVGPYRLIRELGRGGMGQVWLAEREDSFRREVALKLVKLGMDTEEVVRRFQRERQLLADLEHPGIVRLLDGGATDEGRPYLVLERVEGAPLDEHCRARGLGVEARLGIFARTCEAVAAAHALGVVHRDLKPSNILVTSEGEPKVLDFGIAKVLSDEGPEPSLLTRTGERLLTPRYAAPEQVRGEPCSPATDVYALGVLLYELLCDRPPYELQTASLREIESAVCDEAPRRPSAASSVTLRRRLSGDLDVITLRALAKEPARRYRDAGQLAQDVRRHLAHEPIHARPETTGYRLRKFVRRNRWLVGSAAAVFVALAVGLVIATAQYLEARRQTVEAEWRSYVAMIRTAYAQLEAGRTGVVAEDQRPEFHGWEADHLRARGDLSTGLILELDGASHLSIDGSGATLAASRGAELILIDTETRAVRQRIDFGADIRTHALSPAGDLVALSHGKRVQVRDLGSRDLVAEWESEHKVNQLLFHPDGRRLAEESAGVARLRSLDHPDEPRELARDQELRGIAISPSGDRFAGAGHGGWIHVAGIDDPALDASLRFAERKYILNSVAFSRTGRYVAAVVNDGIARIWDLTTELPVSLPMHTGQYSLFVAFRPDRDELVVPGWTIRLWDVQSGAQRTLAGGHYRVRGWAVHPVEPRMYSFDFTGRIMEWDATAAQVSRHRHLRGWLLDLAVSPDAARYAVTCDAESRALALCDLESGTPLAQWSVRELGARLHDVLFLPDGERLVGALDDGVVLLDPNEPEMRRKIPLDGPLSLALAGDGKRILVGTRLGRLVEISTASWSISEEFANDFERINDVALHPDGRRIVVAGASSVSLFDPVAGPTVPLASPGTELARSVDISPDGRWIAGGFDSRLCVWSARTGSVLQEGPLGRVEKVLFTPDGRRLLVAMGTRLEVIDTTRWERVVTFQDALRQIEDMAFAPDGTLLTCDHAGEVLIWRASRKAPPR